MGVTNQSKQSSEFAPEEGMKGIVEHYMGEHGPQTCEVEILCDGPLKHIPKNIGQAAAELANQVKHLVPNLQQFNAQDAWSLFITCCELVKDDYVDIGHVLLSTKRDIYMKPATLLQLFVLSGGCGTGSAHSPVQCWAIVKGALRLEEP